MKFLGAISAMTKDRVIGIGLNGRLPWYYPEDLRRFKHRTSDCTVIMGRLTWESLGCRALPHRRNIVISRSILDTVEHYANIRDALHACKHDRTWVIGGGQVYSSVFNYLTILDITYVPDVISDPEAVLFPEISPESWKANTPTTIKNSPLINIIYERRNLFHRIEDI